MKIVIASFTYFVLSVIFTIGSYILLPDKPSPDIRKTDWHYVTVVNKYDSESCSKSSCRTYRTVVVEIAPDWYEYVNVDASAYASAVVGKEIGLSRHLVDPVYLNAESRFWYGWLNMFISLIVTIFSTLLAPEPKRK